MTRIATLDDMSGIIVLFKEFTTEWLKNFGFVFNRDAAANIVEDMIKNHLVIVEEDKDGQIIGSIAGLIVLSVFTKGYLFQEVFFYCLENHRKAAFTIIRKLEAECKQRGIEKCIMAVPEGLTAEKHRRFYAIRGYKLLETHHIKDLG